MKNKTYSEKLKDPRWQKKRLEIMNRDEFQCQACESTTKTLNVHHWKYESNTNPWEYPDEMLITLCEDCHNLATIKQIVREDGGFINPVDFIMKHPSSILAFSTIGNHEGIWEISFRPEASFETRIKSLVDMKQFIYGMDCNIYDIDTSYDWFDYVLCKSEMNTIDKHGENGVLYGEDNE